MLIDHFLLTNMSIVLRFVNKYRLRMGDTSHIPTSNASILLKRSLIDPVVSVWELITESVNCACIFAGRR
jgi:hypothetical protein